MRKRRIPGNWLCCNARRFRSASGVRIRQLRVKRGWTQDVFADLSGRHRAQVGAFENGRMNITLASLHLIAQTLDVRILDLFKGVEKSVKRKSPQA
jgi:transcriptional regulator with XRE-family HTH domain